MTIATRSERLAQNLAITDRPADVIGLTNEERAARIHVLAQMVRERRERGDPSTEARDLYRRQRAVQSLASGNGGR